MLSNNTIILVQSNMLSNKTTIILVQHKYVIKQNNNHISSTEICYQTEQQSY